MAHGFQMQQRCLVRVSQIHDTDSVHVFIYCDVFHIPESVEFIYYTNVAEKVCFFHQDNLHSKLSNSLNTTFHYNDTMTVTCDQGYWFASEGRARIVTFFCNEDGAFIPEPEFVTCTGKLIITVSENSLFAI